MLEISEKQQSILDSIMNWHKYPNDQYITFGGYAGTGKTTILGYLGNLLHAEKKGLKIAYCCYTGKAARVLARKLKDAKSIHTGDYIGTIHRLIYKAIVDDHDNILGWERIPQDDFAYDLIIVDEASMVTQYIWNDLRSFDVPILAVGDHGQLPPVEGNFNLMENPNLRLEEIFRQEKDNPIIKVSEIARKYGKVPTLDFSPTVRKISKQGEDTNDLITDLFSSFNDEMMILTGYNSTRVKINKGIRQLLEFETEAPTEGDRVICLKNNTNEGIFNGMTGTLLSIQKEDMGGIKYYDAEISLDGEDDTYLGKLCIEQFGKTEIVHTRLEDNINLFDFGYALTVHKAQGSQAKKVILFEERFPNMTDDLWRKWLYTGVTRAEEELYVIG